MRLCFYQTVKEFSHFLFVCVRMCVYVCACVCGCPSQRHSDVADPNDWDIIGRVSGGGLC